MDPRALLAAHNNARWCDRICRAHGIATTFAAPAWFAHRRSPPLYPDAVTLRPDVTPRDLLPRIDSTAGCSIKDSFASVDLSDDGFTLLFEAEWVYREPPPRSATSHHPRTLFTHDGVVGLYDMFAEGSGDAWAEACDAAGAQSPGLPLVSYARGAHLAAAHRAGFVSVGPLRVWTKA